MNERNVMESSSKSENLYYSAQVFVGLLLLHPELVSELEPPISAGAFDKLATNKIISDIYRGFIRLADTCAAGETTLVSNVKRQVFDMVLNYDGLANEADYFNTMDSCCRAAGEEEDGGDTRAYFIRVYRRLQKYLLLNGLQAKGYKTDHLDPRITSGDQAKKIKEFNDLEDPSGLLVGYERDIAYLKSLYQVNSHSAIHADKGILGIVNGYKEVPDIGAPMCGHYLNSIIGGARRGTMFLRSAASNAGKAIPDYIEIPMYDGTWKRVGDVRPGDLLIGSDGGPTEVLKIYPQATPKQIYQVCFADGRIAECCGEHLWQITMDERTYVMDTRELMEYVNGDGFPTCYIPMVKPVQYAAQQYAIAPDELGRKIQAGTWKAPPSKKYLIGSVEQRQSLYNNAAVDGVSSKRSQFFDAEHLESLFAFRELCFSLGKSCRVIRTANGYRLDTKDFDRLAIKEIVKTDRFTEMTCFTVDAVDALFCMNDYIVTHNTRLSVFDACKIAYPLHWDRKRNGWILEGHPPEKVLYITTEMTPKEIQTIILAFISGVEEQHIKRGAYEPGEEERIEQAIFIMEKYTDYFILDSIPNPDLNNVKTTIKRHIVLEGVGYVFNKGLCKNKPFARRGRIYG